MRSLDMNTFNTTNPMTDAREGVAPTAEGRVVMAVRPEGTDI